jgi:hypothetical protein
LENALHFSHFEKQIEQPRIKLRDRIKIKEKVHIKGRPIIKIHESTIKVNIQQQEEIPKIHID